MYKINRGIANISTARTPKAKISGSSVGLMKSGGVPSGSISNAGHRTDDEFLNPAVLSSFHNYVDESVIANMLEDQSVSHPSFSGRQDTTGFIHVPQSTEASLAPQSFMYKQSDLDMNTKKAPVGNRNAGEPKISTVGNPGLQEDSSQVRRRTGRVLKGLAGTALAAGALYGGYQYYKHNPGFSKLLMTAGGAVRDAHSVTLSALNRGAEAVARTAHAARNAEFIHSNQMQGIEPVWMREANTPNLVNASDIVSRTLEIGGHIGGLVGPSIVENLVRRGVASYNGPRTRPNRVESVSTGRKRRASNSDLRVGRDVKFKNS